MRSLDDATSGCGTIQCNCATRGIAGFGVGAESGTTVHLLDATAASANHFAIRPHAFAPVSAAAMHKQPESDPFNPENIQSPTTEEPHSLQPPQAASEAGGHLLPPMEPADEPAGVGNPSSSLHEVQHVTHEAESQALNEGQAPQARSPLPSSPPSGEEGAVPLTEPGQQTGGVQVLQQLYLSEHVSVALTSLFSGYAKALPETLSNSDN